MLADHPEEVGQILGELVAGAAFGVHAEARAAVAKAARESASATLDTTESELLPNTNEDIPPLNNAETPRPYKGLIDLSRIEQKARSLQADAQAVLSEVSEEMTDTQEILNAAARRQAFILEKVIKINDMSAEQLQREILRTWILNMEDSNKLIRAIRDQVK